MTKTSDLILYKASAGSGKTYTLAKEYLKIIAVNPYEYRKILAVTFTRKATEEMKSRIIEYLTRLEQQDAGLSALRNSILDEVLLDKGIDIREIFDANISKALQLILHDYSNFNISTIDSFFQGIIRSFARELDLPVGMEVELDVDSVIDHAVQQVLKAYKSEKDTFSGWLEEYVFDLIEEDKSWKIERNITQLARQLIKEEYHHHITANEASFDMETYKKVLTELKQLIYTYRKKLTELTEQVEEKITRNNLDLNLFFQGNKSVQSFIKKTRHFAPEVNAYLQKMLDGEPVYSKTKIKDATTIQELESAWNNYICPYVTDVLDWKAQHHAKYVSALLVMKQIYSLALLANINNRIKQYKADENLILISDTNHIVSLIARHEEVPFIFEKSANFLKYILIDEFQDTSSLQWNGMLPLLLELLQQVDGLVLIVGDPKQSIYRWRGGKMELIADGIAPDLTYHWDTRKDRPLLENYRSAPEIVRFNNALFESVRNTAEFKNPMYYNVLSDIKQTEKRIGLSGYVQCKWLEKVKGAEEDLHLIELTNIIRSLEGRKSYGEIAILTRSNTDGALVANYLQQQHIPVVSAESLLLEHQHSVKLLIAAMQYIVNPDEIFYALKLNYQLAVFRQQDEPERFLQRQEKDPYFFETEVPFLAKNTMRHLSSVSVLELVFLLIKNLKLDVHTDNYLWRFQDVVLKHSQQQSHSVSEFLEFWEEQKEKLSILPPDGMNAVKIYTIHKSKGLQFPVVILPYADWSLKPKHDSTIWVQSSEPPFDQLKAIPVEMNSSMEESLFADYYHTEMEASYVDNINLLYVACTRAEEQLYILCNSTKANKAEKPNTAGKLLKSVLSAIELSGSEWHEETFSYGIISEETASVTEHTAIHAIVPGNYADFRESIELSIPKEFSEAQVKGTLLHDILSGIEHPAQLEKAVHTYVKDAAEAAPYLEAGRRVIRCFEQQQWFAPEWKHLSERGVRYKEEVLRPDKVLLSGQECIIIDYKTGAKEKGHINQVRQYMEAFKSLRTQEVSGYLLYIDTMELEPVNN
jgi:ATP-dependent helicase/nuclease subunit A